MEVKRVHVQLGNKRREAETCTETFRNNTTVTHKNGNVLSVDLGTLLGPFTCSRHGNFSLHLGMYKIQYEGTGTKTL